MPKTRVKNKEKTRPKYQILSSFCGGTFYNVLNMPAKNHSKLYIDFIVEAKLLEG